MEVRRLTVQRRRGSPELPRLIFLAVFFLLGLVFGQAIALRVPREILAELKAYLGEFLCLEHLAVSETVLSTLLFYFRYPLLAFLLGFASIGVIFLPLTGLAFGFFLSFSVSCFTTIFGRNGVLLALALFGFRCAVTIPAFFLLAVPSLNASGTLAGIGKKGRRAMPVVYGKECWLRLAVVCGVLFAGVLVDLMISPYLLDFVLRRILN